MYFAKEMMYVAKKLKEFNFEVILPPTLEKYGKSAQELTSNYEELLKMKQELARYHFDKIKESDAIIVINNEKNGIINYIGGATFAEIAYAFYLRKKIFLINPIPVKLPYTDELRSFEPIILESIDHIKNYLLK